MYIAMSYICVLLVDHERYYRKMYLIKTSYISYI